MNTYQLYIKSPSNQPFDGTQDRFQPTCGPSSESSPEGWQPIGPPTPAVNANLWYQLLLAHFGSGEVEMRPVDGTGVRVEGLGFTLDPTPETLYPVVITARSVWPGEE